VSRQPIHTNIHTAASHKRWMDGWMDRWIAIKTPPSKAQHSRAQNSTAQQSEQQAPPPNLSFPLSLSLSLVGRVLLCVCAVCLPAYAPSLLPQDIHPRNAINQCPPPLICLLLRELNTHKFVFCEPSWLMYVCVCVVSSTYYPSGCLPASCITVSQHSAIHATTHTHTYTHAQSSLKQNKGSLNIIIFQVM